MSETLASPPGRSRVWATVIAGVVLGVGTLVARVSGADPKPGAEYSSPATLSAPGHGPQQAAPSWATTGQLEQLKAELTAEIRGYRGDVAGALKQLEQTTSRLHEVEIQQAEQRGEQRARTAGYRR